MPGRLSDRLREASRRLFVGRKAQCELFEEVIQAEEPPFSVLHIYGPGGIGKTTLLYEFQRLCRGNDIPFIYLDARTIDADATSFKRELSRTLGLSNEDAPEQKLGVGGRHVLMVDTFELLSALEQWLFGEFFAELHETVFIVLAGRFPLSAGWKNHPGWGALIRAVSLRNLSATESKIYLTGAGMPDAYHQAVIDYTYGHPLALSLIAESFAQRPDAAFGGDMAPDFIKVLVDRFVMDAPGPMHRLALEASGLVHNLTESLLAALLDRGDVGEIFAWLRQLSFMESGPRGLFPHDLARDVINAELRWRNPETYKMLHERARAYYNIRLHDASPEKQRLLLTDYIFLHRDNPIVQPFFQRLQAQWQEVAATVASDRFKDGDEAAVLEMVATHEGDRSVEQARRWLQRQPERVVVYRNENGRPVGFLLLLALQEASPADLEEDDVAGSCWSFLEQERPLRPGESATLFRFWMDAQSHHQLSRIQSHIFVQMVRHYLTTPNLAYSFLPIAHPDFWASIFSYADLHRLGSLDFKENDTPYGIFGHDWRSRPPAAWLDLLASREIGGGSEAIPDSTPKRRILVLSEEAFEKAVRDALRAYTRPRALKRNPLLSSRIVADRVDADAGDERRIQILQDLLSECIDALKNNPRQGKTHRAVDRTYVRPAASQEQAAEMLDLPYSTFRRHLAHGVREITSMLWEREIGL